MTAYSIPTGNPTTVGVIAVTYQLRITKIEVVANSSPWLNIFRYTSAGLSGGSSVTPVPMRQGAPAATATAKSGASATGTGTLILTRGAGSIDYQWPFDLLISPGSGLFLVGAVSSGSTTVSGSLGSVTLYFEEPRLTRSF